ncbi:s-adenosyl-L-methionine-dependent methyltransferase [Fusarium beomiforme]|uniref:S-adenosyl-L-methionine-dependent methyltransferase n=1 Tax=Fusarium beomiforme TaxID=44412 RepID=A0A9P5A691_9HYPO|nr:s-adenosyl-L-methionine-dependent methyltransferase [Fusarium beomiforme]
MAAGNLTFPLSGSSVRRTAGNVLTECMVWSFTILELGSISYKEGLPVVPSIVGQANRVVVDVGRPGTGQNLRQFDREKITKLYLIEPNVGMHAELEANLCKSGLSDIATVISCGVQDSMALSSHGLSPCTADSVVNVNALCCVASQESTCESLYSLLKPGGQWLVYEHVVAEQKYTIPRLSQHAYNMVWLFFLGVCNIKRDTTEALKGAGTWDTVNLGSKNGEEQYDLCARCLSGRVDDAIQKQACDQVNAKESDMASHFKQLALKLIQRHLWNPGTRYHKASASSNESTAIMADCFLIPKLGLGRYWQHQ